MVYAPFQVDFSKVFIHQKKILNLLSWVIYWCLQMKNKTYKISTIIDSIFWNLKKHAVVYLTKNRSSNATIALVKVKDTPMCPTIIGDNRENETPDIDTVPPYGLIQDYINLLTCLVPFQCHTCPALLLKNPKVTLQCITTNTQVPSVNRNLLICFEVCI